MVQCDTQGQAAPRAGLALRVDVGLEDRRGVRLGDGGLEVRVPAAENSSGKMTPGHGTREVPETTGQIGMTLVTLSILSAGTTT